MDKQLIHARFSKSLPTYATDAVVQREIAEHLAELAARFVPHSVSHCLEIGCGTGQLTRALAKRIQIQHLTLNDICEQAIDYYEPTAGTEVGFCVGDAEQLTLAADYRLIASASTLQWFDDPIAFLRQAKAWLTPEGIIAVSLFGKRNMEEITSFTNISLPYPELTTLCHELSTDFDIVCAEEQHISTGFDSPLSVLRHLKRTGVTGICAYRWTPSTLEAFQHYYRRQFQCGEHDVYLTYHPLYLILKPKL